MHRHNWRMYAGLLFATGYLIQNAAAPRSISGSEAPDQFCVHHSQPAAGRLTIGRGAHVHYLTRIGARLSAAHQMIFAVGNEVIQ